MIWMASALYLPNVSSDGKAFQDNDWLGGSMVPGLAPSGFGDATWRAQLPGYFKIRPGFLSCVPLRHFAKKDWWRQGHPT